MRISDDTLLKTIWDYLMVESPLFPADVIVVGGSRDLGTSIKASELYNLGYAPLIVFSGYQQQGMEDSEANLLAQVAEEHGVPSSAILRETMATNTGQNIQFTKKLLINQGIIAEKVILIHKPYMTRRFLAAAEVQWVDPKPQLMIAHEKISIDDYYQRQGREDVIYKMLGDFMRMESYVKKGFQSPQVIPPQVQKAYDLLIERGFLVR